MRTLIDLHDRLWAWLDRLLGSWLVPTLARIVFTGVLAVYFWASAMTKVGSGLFGFLFLDFGAYAQMFPKVFEAANYDPSALGAGYKAIAIAGTWGEFILPALIILGLLTRIAAIGMIIFVVVQSLTDIYGHNADAATIGAWLDRPSDALIVDQRAFWIFLLLILVLRGAGPLSIDWLLGIGRQQRPPVATEA